MREKEFELVCACGNPFTIITSSDDPITTCPFCGADLENKVELDEEYDDE